MSKRFKTQDYFRYKKLGKRWRKPVGLQSKLRLKKGGSGLRPAMGYGTVNKLRPLLVYNINDLQKDVSNGILIAGSVGRKKTAAIAAKAKELNIKIINMNKAKGAMKFKKALEKKKTQTKEKKPEKPKETKTEAKAEEQKDVGAGQNTATEKAEQE
ncbi:MAG TPA: eL32 family ribosomal protein [archaeon]|nr:eL32 family ribosomal protein [archaeon]